MKHACSSARSVIDRFFTAEVRDAKIVQELQQTLDTHVFHSPKGGSKRERKRQANGERPVRCTGCESYYRNRISMQQRQAKAAVAA